MVMVGVGFVPSKGAVDVSLAPLHTTSSMELLDKSSSIPLVCRRLHRLWIVLCPRHVVAGLSPQQETLLINSFYLRFSQKVRGATWELADVRTCMYMRTIPHAHRS